MARTIAVLGASNTGKSTLVDRMCALEGQPQPAAAPGRAAGRELHPSRRELAGDRHPGLDRAPARRDRRAARRRRRGGLRRPRPGRRRCSPRPTCTPPRPPARPALLFINRIDEATARVRDIVAALQDYASHPIVLRQIPIRDGGAITGAVDLVSERAWAYREGEPSQLIEIPAGTLDREHEARGELLEHLSEFDDHLLEELIEDREPPSDEVYALCARVLAREPGHRGADRLRRPRQRHRPRDEGAAPRGPAARGAARAAAGAGRPRRAARRRWSSPAPTASTSARPCSCARSSRSPPAARSAAAPPASSPPPTRATPATSTRCPRAMIVSAVKADHLAAGRLATAGRAARRRPAWHRPQPADHAAHPRPHRRARQRQALGRARLARRRRRRARRSARTRPPAARWSARRARCTCASSASG